MGLTDRLSRRRVLSITAPHFHPRVLVSAFAPTAALFTVAQLLARIFLIGEWAVASVVAAEGTPPNRGTVIGTVSAATRAADYRVSVVRLLGQWMAPGRT
ncbi:MAG: hypothetical protein R3A48_19385 [Polyangiales bacterium]